MESTSDISHIDTVSRLVPLAPAPQERSLLTRLKDPSIPICRAQCAPTAKPVRAGDVKGLG